MRVVNILGFRRGYNYRNEMLALAKPFGKVVKHLVLDLRPEVRTPNWFALRSGIGIRSGFSAVLRACAAVCAE